MYFLVLLFYDIIRVSRGTEHQNEPNRMTKNLDFSVKKNRGIIRVCKGVTAHGTRVEVVTAILTKANFPLFFDK